MALAKFLPHQLHMNEIVFKSLSDLLASPGDCKPRDSGASICSVENVIFLEPLEVNTGKIVKTAQKLLCPNITYFHS